MTDVRREGSVLVLSMDEERLTTAALDAWSAALDEIDADESIAALVSTGTGKHYNNGLDLDAVAADPSMFEGYIGRVHDLLLRVATLPVATVAAVNGHAFGAGAMLAVVHDAAVMRADRGYWCLPEADLGLPFTPVMREVLLARLPRRTAYDAMTTSRRFGGADAAAAGVVSETAAEVDVVSRSLERAVARAGKNRPALAEIKRGLYAAALSHATG